VSRDEWVAAFVVHLRRLEPSLPSQLVCAMALTDYRADVDPQEAAIARTRNRMEVDFNLPTVVVPAEAMSNYWGRYMFVGTPSEIAQVNALASTFMRLTASAIDEYGLGVKALRAVWADHTSLGLYEMHKSIAHFEHCVSDMHRAIRAYRALRKAQDPLALYLAEDEPTRKPAFVSDGVATPVRNVRDAIHHLEQKLFNGEITDGQHVVVGPTGPERPHPTQAGQILKTFDRLAIGPHELTFSDIAACLSEMGQVAARIAQFDRPGLSSDDATSEDVLQVVDASLKT
jgi:hypothetical protein